MGGRPRTDGAKPAPVLESASASAQISPSELTKCNEVNVSFCFRSVKARHHTTFSLFGRNSILPRGLFRPLSDPSDVNFVTFCQFRRRNLRRHPTSEQTSRSKMNGKPVPCSSCARASASIARQAYGCLAGLMPLPTPRSDRLPGRKHRVSRFPSSQESPARRLSPPGCEQHGR